MTQGEATIAAAILSAGVTANMPSSAQIGQNGQLDAPTQAKNWYEWEVFRVFYNAIVQIPGDAKDWPVPAAGAGGADVTGVLTGIVKQLAGPQASALIAALQAVVSGLNPTPTPSK